MEEGLDLDFPRQLASENSRKQFDGGLNQSFRPSSLLALERIHLNRKLGGTNDVRQVKELPSGHLGAIAEIGVFSQRIVLPSSSAFNCGAPPNACRAVEIEEPPGEMPSAVFDDEVAIENYRLHLRQQRIFAIDVAPTHLNHSDLRIAEIIDNVFQEVRRRNEIRIEDGDQFTCR